MILSTATLTHDDAPKLAAALQRAQARIRELGAGQVIHHSYLLHHKQGVLRRAKRGLDFASICLGNGPRNLWA